MLSSSTQFATVDAKGIFALFTFLMSRQKEFIILDCFIAKHSGPERGLPSALHAQ